MKFNKIITLLALGLSTVAGFLLVIYDGQTHTPSTNQHTTPTTTPIVIGGEPPPQIAGVHKDPVPTATPAVQYVNCKIEGNVFTTTAENCQKRIDDYERELKEITEDIKRMLNEQAEYDDSYLDYMYDQNQQEANKITQDYINGISEPAATQPLPTVSFSKTAPCATHEVLTADGNCIDPNPIVPQGQISP